MSIEAPSRTSMPLVFLASIGLAVIFVALLNAVPMASNDLWLQLKVGQLIADTHTIPRTLLFPFTAARDATFNAHEWLASLLFHEASRVVGEGGLMLVQVAFGLAQFALCFLLARRLSRSTGAALLLAMLAMLTVNFRYVLRPEVFALLFLVLLLDVLSRYRATGRRAVLLWTVPLGIAWANCHGSFLLGPAIAGIFAVGEAASAAFARRADATSPRLQRAWQAGWPYAAAALAMLLACLVNPRGPELLAFAFQVQGSDAIKGLIKEWLPTFHPLFVVERGFWIFAVTSVLSTGLLAVRWRDVTLTDLALFVAFAGLAMLRNRHIVWFAFVALAVCASVLGRRDIPARVEERLRIAVAALALIGISLCVRFGNARYAFIYESPSNNFTPPMAAELARPDLSGNVFNSYELGSELIYRDWPRLKPSIDSRVDSYGDGYFLAHESLFLDEPRLLEFLENQRVGYMLLLRRDFDNNVRNMPHVAAAWHMRFADLKMALLERNVPLPAAAASASAR